MDIVFIHDLKVKTVIGVFAWERRIRQTVCFNLEMGCDISAAAASDQLAHALDYKAISKRITAFVEQAEFQLVETLAESVARLVREEFGVAWLRLSLSKPGALSAARDVGIVIERGAKPA